MQTFELQESFDVLMHHFPVMWEWELPLMNESSIIKQKNEMQSGKKLPIITEFKSDNKSTYNE